MQPVLLVTLAASLLTAAPPTARKPDDLKKLQGTWNAVSAQIDGRKFTEDDIPPLSFTIEGNRFTVKDANVVAERGTLRIDNGPRPRTLDATFTAGPDQGKTSLAIYEIMGDTLELCIAPAGRERPKTFAAPQGSGIRLFVLRHQLPVEDTKPGKP